MPVLAATFFLTMYPQVRNSVAVGVYRYVRLISASLEQIIIRSLSGSILSEPSDLSCLLRIPKGGQRFLEIRRPNEVEEKKDEKKKDETAGKNDDEVVSSTSFCCKHDD